MTTATEKPPRKQQLRSLRTKQKLLDAALEAFSEGGFLGTSTRDIAARAGVHHPLITYHFSSKERLWKAAVQHVFADFVRALLDTQTRCAGDDAKTRFAAMIRICVQYSTDHPALHKILLQESSTPSSRLDWLCESYLKPISDVATAIITELQQQGMAPAGNPAMIYNMIRASSCSLIALALETKITCNIDFSSEETLDELADLIVRVFLPGARNKT